MASATEIANALMKDANALEMRQEYHEAIAKLEMVTSIVAVVRQFSALASRMRHDVLSFRVNCSY